jgi:hypothetical protein
MKLRMAIFIVLSLAGPLAAVYLRNPLSSAESLAWIEQAKPQTAGEKRVVIVELFTSEGCSSCPPADALLMQLEEKQPVAGAEIIALSEHVDYWNRLGWADPYSSPLFSQRQSEYSRAFHLDDIYTPQMVVDGRAEFVGSSATRARDVLQEAMKAPKASLTLSRTARAQANEITLAIKVDQLPQGKDGDTLDVYLAVTESHLNSNVLRGENSGRKLAHTAVVRQLKTIGSLEATTQTFNSTETLVGEKNWKPENLKVVAFVQQRLSRRILGAAAVKWIG